MPAFATLTTRELPDGSGWIVQASWPDREPEQLVGVFTSPQGAELWIEFSSQAWRSPPALDE
jgi:hypothetical protein